jgi:metal-sulfur cluster biosynthetic enzyme
MKKTKKTKKQTLSKAKVLAALKKVVDPELGFNIVDMGLIYKVSVKDKSVDIKMTFTSPFCPLGNAIIEDVKRNILRIGGIPKIDIVFHPLWNPKKMKPELRATLPY